MAFDPVIGLLLEVLSFIWVKSLYGVEHLFNQLRVLNDLKPAIGAVVVGILGVFLSEYGVMGVGYEGIDLALKGLIPLSLLGILFVSKLIATSFTIGSGGSGGIFAPSLYMGAMVGMFLGSLINPLLPVEPKVMLLVGMAALFSGAARTPLTSTVLVSEVAGNYWLIIPLLLPCIVSFLIASILLKKSSIYTLRLELKGLYIRPAAI